MYPRPARPTYGSPMSFEPKLRQKSNGAWSTYWGGKEHYLSTDEAEARYLFFDARSHHPGSLAAFKAWNASRVDGTATAQLRRIRKVTLQTAADAFLETQNGRMVAKTVRYYRHHLQRFLSLHGDRTVEELTSIDPRTRRFSPPIVHLLEAYRQDMINGDAVISPHTLKHDITAVKRLMAWCHSPMMLCPEVTWGAVKPVTLPPAKPEPLKPRGIEAALIGLISVDARLVPWLAVGYLTGARPSELIRLIASRGALALPAVEVHGSLQPRAGEHGAFMAIEDEHGEILQEPGAEAGVFDFKGTHKMARAGQLRFLLLSHEAQQWLSLSYPFWRSADAYAAACRESQLPAWPHRMRDSFASHLLARRAPAEDVDLALGHDRRGVLRSYGAVPVARLWRLVSTLSLARVLESFPKDYADRVPSEQWRRVPAELRPSSAPSPGATVTERTRRTRAKRRS